MLAKTCWKEIAEQKKKGEFLSGCGHISSGIQLRQVYFGEMLVKQFGTAGDVMTNSQATFPKRLQRMDTLVPADQQRLIYIRSMSTPGAV